MKTDLNFEYEKHLDLINFFIDEIRDKFEYIFIDLNNSCDLITNSILSVIGEVFFVFNDTEIDLYRIFKIINKVRKFKKWMGVRSRELVLF